MRLGASLHGFALLPFLCLLLFFPIASFRVSKVAVRVCLQLFLQEWPEHPLWNATWVNHPVMTITIETTCLAQHPTLASLPTVTIPITHSLTQDKCPQPPVASYLQLLLNLLSRLSLHFLTSLCSHTWSPLTYVPAMLLTISSQDTSSSLSLLSVWSYF